MHEEIWYAAYGTNLARARLDCYLAGGIPPGAALATPGARDPSPPRAVRPLRLTGEVLFGWESPTWGGGVAFYDPAGPGTVAARGYLLTRGQLSDVAAQEMHRAPGADLDLDALLLSGTHVFGAGRYETMHVVGDVDGAPVVTFTASWGDGSPTYTAPSAAYLLTMGGGLREAHGWDAERTAAYLLARPGIGSTWTTASVRALLDGDAG
ncbi:hypothetical protein BH11ACT8_BH11ACT8_34760 [soil metagenome]